jgi:hypothetical protein
MGVLGGIHTMTGDHMHRFALAGALLLAPVAVSAQQVQTAQSAFASALAGNLSNALAQLDDANHKIADLQKQLADAQAKAKPADPEKK